MKESITLTFQRYRDMDGHPTCAVNFETGEICQFYRTQRFGTNETCLFAPADDHGIQTTLSRRNPNGMGTLIPGPCCQLFTEKEMEYHG